MHSTSRPIPGTLFHQQGQQAFTLGSAASSGNFDADTVTETMQDKIRETAKRYRDVNRAIREDIQADRDRVRREGESKAKDLLAGHCVLASMSDGEWVSFNHSCPALAFTVASHHAQTRMQETSASARQLSSQWVARHRPVPADAKSRTRSAQVASCFREGICHCGPRNKLLRDLLAAAQTVMKRASAQKHVQKMWVDGLVVLCWFSPATEEQAAEVVYTWVALHYLRPWRPTLLLLRSKAEAVLSSAVQGSSADRHSERPVTLEIVVERSGDREQIPAFRTLLGLLSTLDVGRPWFLRVMHLSQNRCPAECPFSMVRAHPSEVVEQVWNPDATDMDLALEVLCANMRGPHVREEEDDEATGSEAAEQMNVPGAGHEDEGSSADSDVIFAEDFANLMEAAANENQDRSLEDDRDAESSSSSIAASAPPSPRGGPAEDEEIRAVPVAAEAAVARGARQVRAETFYYGSFRMTFRPPCSYQATCPYHPPEPGMSARCTKSGSWTQGDEAEMRSVLVKLKSWCLQATLHENKGSHQGARRLAAALPEHERMSDEALQEAVARMRPPLE